MDEDDEVDLLLDSITISFKKLHETTNQAIKKRLDDIRNAGSIKTPINMILSRIKNDVETCNKAFKETSCLVDKFCDLEKVKSMPASIDDKNTMRIAHKIELFDTNMKWFSTVEQQAEIMKKSFDLTRHQ